MDIRFTRNAETTVGIELELHVVDPETGDLASASNEILGTIGARHPGGQHPKAKHELFQSTIEIITGICANPAEGKADLEETLREVQAEAANRGLKLMSAGTHPFARCADQLVSPNPRYHTLVEQMQWPARRLLICGAHYHVGLESGEQAIAVVNELQRHLPLFVIASASSPYLETEDTGLASARSKVFESLPTAGLPPILTDWHDFESFMQTLLTARCISSIREVWWDVRPHPDFGTVELRMCDAPSTLRETVALAALAQALVADAAGRFNRGELPPPPREWTIRENRWLAARYGVEAKLIVDDEGRREPARAVLERLIDDLRPTAERLGSSAELEDVLELWSIGPSYLRQRRMIEAGCSLQDVVAGLIEQLETDEPR
ncbi:MAG: glutamate--cysteine ligase [Acidimicrobiia bacterium]|nr:glutamate--cysteine ligase [Acidimicrobiia bacterium]